MADQKATEKGPAVPVPDPSKVGSTPATLEDDGVSTADQLLYTDEPNGPNAGDLRKAGYVVPEGVKDGDVPTSYSTSTVRTDPKPHLVQDLAPLDLVLHDKTPAEVAGGDKAGKAAEDVGPLILTTTPAEQAKKDSKGTDAEKQGPRPTATTLNVTPVQAAAESKA